MSRSIEIQLSVIIPIFNGEKYIKQLETTLLEQNILRGNILTEVFLVNDGSTDSTSNMLNQLVKKYPEVKLLNTNRQGPAKARLKGLSYSRGRYFYFMDCDDRIVRGMLPTMLALAEKEDADVVQYKYAYVQVGDEYKYDGQVIEMPMSQDTEILSGKTFLETDGLKWNQGLCNKIFKRKDLEDILKYYDSRVNFFYEDLVFNTCYFLNAKKVIRVNQAGYLYIQYPGSLIHNKNIDHQKLVQNDNQYIGAFYMNLFNLFKNVEGYEKLSKCFIQSSNWYIFVFWTKMFQLRGLSKADALKYYDWQCNEKLLPISSSYPIKSFGMPSGIVYKTLWRLVSNKWLLKLVINLRF